MSSYSVKQVHSLPVLFFHEIPFHSARDPFKEASFLDRLRGPKPFPPVVFLVEVGLGYVLSFFKKNPDLLRNTRVFCLFKEEVGREIFERYRKILDWPQEVQSLLLSERQTWENLLFQSLAEDVSIWVHPTFQRLEPKESQAIQNELHTILKRSLMNQITDVAFGFRWWRNALRNLIFSTMSPLSLSAGPLKDNEFPFLLVGSGLTAYREMQNIANLQKYYWIVAAPPVLDLLRKWDITPDIVVMTDPAAANRFYRSIKDLSSRTLLVAYGYVYSLLVEWFPGTVLGLNGGLEQENCLTPAWDCLPSGGSVANTMLDLAGIWGKEIFYTGFDFAYTQSHPHYPGSPLETQGLFEASRYATVESRFANRVLGSESFVDGGVRTSRVLKAYREYFEEQCRVLLSKGYSIDPWGRDGAVSSRKREKGIFSDQYLRDIAIPPISKGQKMIELQKLHQLLQEDIDNETWHHFCWKSLLAKSTVKKTSGQEVLKREEKLIAHLLQKMDFGAMSEILTTKDE